ncbi:MAG: DUF4388 domain-containing protein [Deltaproteobacteria bacterium]|nr:DUF4388 domain-containing protein [Deltaproteobacteria bacterium]
MSLIGSLEDLSLADILQIISLSQKSGVLNIRGEEGDGQILFREGLVRAAQVKGGADSLRGVLVDGGFVSGEDYAAALEQSHDQGGCLEDALAERTSINRERIDSLRREAAESAVVAMFSWCTGEFSFDVGVDESELEESLLLPQGVNAQYLAMEGLRVHDEATRVDDSAAGRDAAAAVSVAAEATTADSAASAEAFFGLGPSDASESRSSESRAGEAAVDALVEATAHLLPELGLGLDPAGERAGSVEASLLDPEVSAEQGQVARGGGNHADRPPAHAAGASERPPVVVIEPELVVLEWVKGALSEVFGQVHIFQRSEQGLSRIRQYLARAQTPLVILSPSIEGNPMSGISDSRDFVQRLKKQAPSMPVLWLAERSGGEDPAARGSADGWLWRPPARVLQSEEKPGASAGEFCADLLQRLGGADTTGEPRR